MQPEITIQKYESLVCAYEAASVIKGGILLYGSSFFTRWTNAAAEVAAASGGKYTVVNHGFGGATVEELMYYYPRLVLPYEPRVMVTRIGPNDFGHGFTPVEAWENALSMYETTRKAFPGIRIVIFDCFEHPSASEKGRVKYAAFDALQRAYADATEAVDFVRISDFFYEKPESVGSYEGFRDVFIEDGLHLKPAVYREFADYFVNKLAELSI